jgi:hypothetical protein
MVETAANSPRTSPWSADTGLPELACVAPQAQFLPVGGHLTSPLSSQRRTLALRQRRYQGGSNTASCPAGAWQCSSGVRFRRSSSAWDHRCRRHRDGRQGRPVSFAFISGAAWCGGLGCEAACVGSSRRVLSQSDPVVLEVIFEVVRPWTPSRSPGPPARHQPSYRVLSPVQAKTQLPQHHSFSCCIMGSN